MAAQAGAVGLLLLLLCAGPLRAQVHPAETHPSRAVVAATALPTCNAMTGSWSMTELRVYLTPNGGVETRTATIPLPNTVTVSWPCPTVAGTYSIRVALANAAGQESIKSLPQTFVVGIPPVLVFTVGAHVQVTANLLNVRAAPGGAILGVQPKGALATITGPSVTLAGSTWWPLDYATGADGWSAEAFLAVVP